MQIEVTVEQIRVAKPDGWYLFRAVMKSNGIQMSVTCKGKMGWKPNEQETLALIGSWVVYKGERQFQFTTAKLTLPLDSRAQLHYVCERAKGIGIAIESAIWDLHRENWKDLKVGEIKKLTASAFGRFQEQLELFERNGEKAEIIAWLEDKGCTASMAADAYARWGSDTAGIVSADCYQLAQLPGYSFRTVDENIRRAFEIGDDDPRRIRSGVEYAMQQETADGSTAVDCWAHLAACEKLLPNIGRDLIVQTVKDLIKEGNLHIFPESLRMALKKDYLAEEIIADFVRMAANCGPDQGERSLSDDEFAAGEKFRPDESQLEAVRYAVTHRFAIINGGAGVGKTTVIKMIVRGIRASFPKLEVYLCAPTGKAAARLKEASGINATTIHVMLGCNGENSFSAGQLDRKAIIVDESSMVESALLAEIVKRNPARLVLVGDQAQLTPVGKGQPFHDIINLYPDCIRTLTKCYRNTEAVFQAATAIRNGDIPVRHAESAKERWTMVPAGNPQEVENMICDWAKNGIIDFEQDIVLCPKNGKKEDDGYQDATVNGLNIDLLAIDREKRGSIAAYKYQRGDRVINTENMPQAHVWNGTTGTVEAEDDAGGVFVHLDVPFTGDDGEPCDQVHFDKDMAKSLQYAYALTVHKSQGSQYRKVIIAVLARDKFSLDRSLIYTAVTRTRQECVIIGDYNAFVSGISTVRHKTTVLQYIRKEVQQ